jgi:hypothetical protein
MRAHAAGWIFYVSDVSLKKLAGKTARTGLRCSDDSAVAIALIEFPFSAGA